MSFTFFNEFYEPKKRWYLKIPSPYFRQVWSLPLQLDQVDNPVLFKYNVMQKVYVPEYV